jgi:hypothetical protein
MRNYPRDGTFTSERRAATLTQHACKSRASGRPHAEVRYTALCVVTRPPNYGFQRPAGAGVRGSPTLASARRR